MVACETQEAIAQATGMEQKTIANKAEDFRNFGHVSENPKSLASHASDFQAPIYNIWKQQEKTPGSVAELPERAADRSANGNSAEDCCRLGAEKATNVGNSVPESRLLVRWKISG